MSGKVAVVLGTRPEIVKLGLVIRALGDRAQVLHTGQHYDVELSQVFFDSFGLHQPVTTLGIGGMSRAQQMGNAISSLEQTLAEEPPSAIVVQGDTNTAAAAAIAANAMEIPLVHVEAGLRSFDRAMPEEHNRVIADHLSDLCLAPTETSKGNLLREGIAEDRIVITGNTVVDAVNHLLPGEDDRKAILAEHGVSPGDFVLSTFHRPENVDSPQQFAAILDALRQLERPVVFPVHPRSRAQIDEHDLDTGGLTLTEPIGYVDFLGLLAECALAVGDSGGVQEEVSVVKRPMVVVRNSTERPEVMGTFCRLTTPGVGIVEAASAFLPTNSPSFTELESIPSPYGDGQASERSVSAITSFLDG